MASGHWEAGLGKCAMAYRHRHIDIGRMDIPRWILAGERWQRGEDGGERALGNLHMGLSEMVTGTDALALAAG